MIFFLSAVPEGRLFGLDQQTLISAAIQLINVVLLAALLTWLLYKPVRRFLLKRAEHIASELARAAADMEKADALKADYEKRIDDVELERASVLEAARELAAVKSQQIIDGAKSDAASAKERSDEEIRKERERISDEIRQHIIDVASVMAEKFVAQTLDREARDRLFNETMAELEDISWQQD